MPKLVFIVKLYMHSSMVYKLGMLASITIKRELAERLKAISLKLIWLK